MKWKAWAVALGAVLILLPFVGWLCLPKSSSAGPLILSARPSRLLADEFTVHLTNVSGNPHEIEDSYVMEGNEAAYFDGFGSQPPTRLNMGESMTEAFSLKGYAAAPHSPGNGLHKISLVRHYQGSSPPASTTAWVLKIGPHIYAIK